MTKKELLESLEDATDDAVIVIWLPNKVDSKFWKKELSDCRIVYSDYDRHTMGVQPAGIVVCDQGCHIEIEVDPEIVKG